MLIHTHCQVCRVKKIHPSQVSGHRRGAQVIKCDCLPGPLRGPSDECPAGPAGNTSGSQAAGVLLGHGRGGRGGPRGEGGHLPRRHEGNVSGRSHRFGMELAWANCAVARVVFIESCHCRPPTTIHVLMVWSGALGPKAGVETLTARVPRAYRRTSLACVFGDRPMSASKNRMNNYGEL